MTRRWRACVNDKMLSPKAKRDKWTSTLRRWYATCSSNNYTPTHTHIRKCARSFKVIVMHAWMLHVHLYVYTIYTAYECVSFAANARRTKRLRKLSALKVQNWHWQTQCCPCPHEACCIQHIDAIIYLSCNLARRMSLSARPIILTHGILFCTLISSAVRWA